LPVAHVNCEEHPNDVALRRHAQAQGQRIYQAAGARRVVFSSTPPATHQMGTARMSAHPAHGVTNPHGRSHEVPNLFVSDGSVFTSAGAANPTLTIVALVLRQADYISRELAAGRL
jgi:choline dehydrogenase-like flavoprotein